MSREREGEKEKEKEKEKDGEREFRCKKMYKNNCCEIHIVHRFTMQRIHSSSSQKLLLWIPVDTRTLSVETSGQVNFAMTIGTADFKNLLYSVNHFTVRAHTYEYTNTLKYCNRVELY